MWVWLLPLVLLALYLSWYVLTRGEPRSPIGTGDPIELEAPDVDMPAPSVETPEFDLPNAPDPDGPAAEQGGAGSPQTEIAPASDPESQEPS